MPLFTQLDCSMLDILWVSRHQIFEHSVLFWPLQAFNLALGQLTVKNYQKKNFSMKLATTRQLGLFSSGRTLTGIFNSLKKTK